MFCNGPETCGNFTCAMAPPPTCDDLDTCTVDSCDASADACLNDPVPPPLDVDGLLVDRLPAPQATAVLSWSASPDASLYNVYQGNVPELKDLACLGGTDTNSASDNGDVPALGDIFVYLVSAVDCFESGLGQDSSGTPRINPAPCP